MGSTTNVSRRGPAGAADSPHAITSRSEHHPGGALEVKVVEQVFRRTAPIWHLHVGGQVIRTTGEHPFFAYNKGWVAAGTLRAGDRLLGHDGQWITVEEVYETAEWETVYNLQIADYHTYFVTDWDWNFAVWSHNLYYIAQYSGGFAPLVFGAERYTLYDSVDGHRVSTSLLGSSDAHVRMQIRAANARGTDPTVPLISAVDPRAITDFDWSVYVGAPNPRTVAVPRRSAGGRVVRHDIFPTHAHHIVMENGPLVSRAAVRASQQILRDAGIDPYFSSLNLTWGPHDGSRGHTARYASTVLTRLTDAARTLGRAGIVTELGNLAREFNNGDFFPPV